MKTKYIMGIQQVLARVIFLLFFPATLLFAQLSGIHIETGETTSISQYEITWTFSEPVKYGQYVTGDYWVIGPVTIVDISRPANNSGRDGSMINPIPHETEQGYDERWGKYVVSQNIANKLPLTVNPGSSIVSSISKDPTVTGVRIRPILTEAAILTVEPEDPGLNSFRPAYSGNIKRHFTAAEINSGILLNLSPVAETANIQDVADLFRRPWIDHVTGWQGDDFHPEKNMNNYGAGISRNSCTGALRLLLNDSINEKRWLLYRYIQLGIDNYGLVENGAVWGDVGGSIGVGRKLPILVAGLLLNDANMMNVAYDYDSRLVFQEDGQTNYLTQTMRDGTYDPVNCDAGTDYCHEGWFDSIALGTPIWTERLRRWEYTAYSYIPGKINYRPITLASTKGAALWVRLLNIENLWNWNPFLEWTDRYEPIAADSAWGSDFIDNMWATYR